MKNISDLPEAQQKILSVILRIKKPAFRTSELLGKVEETSSGRSVGGVLGSLYRNGYLERVSGGRDKGWRLSEEAAKRQDNVYRELSKIKQYWS